MRKQRLLLGTFAIIGGALITFPTPVMATPLFYSTQGIYYYDKDASDVVCRNGSSSKVSDADGSSYIPSGFAFSSSQKSEIDAKIQANMPVYKQIERETGVPSMLLVLLHYRETGLSLNWPDNGQGLYQIVGNAGKYPKSGTATESEFITSTREVAKDFLPSKMSMAANALQKLGYNIKFDPNDPTSISTAFDNEAFLKAVLFAYNGWASIYTKQAENLGYSNAPWEGSPYVMNLWDADRNGSQATDISKWGQVKVDFGSLSYPANDDPGGFTLYVALGGSASSTDCNEIGLGDGPTSAAMARVVKIANQEYAKSPVEYDANVLKYTSGLSVAWCAYFASWVYNEAGVPFAGGYPDDWGVGSVIGLRNYFIKLESEGKAEYYDVGEQHPQPGDIAFYIGTDTPDNGSSEHVNIVISVSSDGKTMTTIGGNESDAVRKGTRKVVLGDQSLSGFGRLK